MSTLALQDKNTTTDLVGPLLLRCSIRSQAERASAAAEIELKTKRRMSAKQTRRPVHELDRSDGIAAKPAELHRGCHQAAAK